MHKNRLQEICQKRVWASPAYTSNREGPDHNPLFSASVTVEGQTFDSKCLCKSLKEAQNKAAEIAINHLSSIVSVSTSPAVNALPFSTKPFKSQLHDYAQKRKIGVPEYISISEGSFHSLRFKARVTVDGQTFESSQYFNTLRDAEHSAARVALMSLPLEENHEILQDEPKFYKILLQDLVQKEGLSLPIYMTRCDGESHMPIFTSTLVLDGKSFVGDVARSKKQAEMNAAKVALDHVKECTINGQTFENSQHFSAVSEAQHPAVSEAQHPAVSEAQYPAASVTLMSSPSEENQEDEPKLYKALLHQLVQKEGLSLPIYNTHSAGESHMPTFTSTVVLDGKNFEGDVAKSKKQAEMNAAKVALKHVKGRINAHSMKLTCGKAIDSMEQSKILTVLPPSSIKTKEMNQFVEVRIEDYERIVAKKTYHDNSNDARNLSFESIDKLDISNVKLDSSRSSVKNESAIVNNSHNSQNVNTCHDDQLSYTNLQLDIDDETESEDSKDVSSDTGMEAIKGEDADVDKIVDSPSFLCNRVLVYPRKPDMVLPAGATLMPFSNDAWVAVNLDFEHEDNLPTIL